MNLLLLLAILGKLGYQVHTARNGQEAVECYKKHFRTIGVVLMDLEMPVMNGFEAFCQIRHFEECVLKHKHHVPVLALTAADTKEYRVSCREHGFEAFLSKPVTKNMLRQELERWVA